MFEFEPVLYLWQAVYNCSYLDIHYIQIDWLCILEENIVNRKIETKKD